ncbi:MAG: hypothetical protein EPN97_04760 [Alphaproteobacteria bacterium]|nr:MAG: hypothetical protein EPN97_04760 [Alphaproteobacteria bacterium]
MGIKSFFNNLAEKREAKRKYNTLAAAIKAGDIEGVRKSLADGADAGYFPGNTKKMPLALALHAGNAEVFETLLKTNGGMSTVMIWHYEFRNLNKTRDINRQIYFLPSYLYAAIECKQEEIALKLVNYPMIDVEESGELMSTGAKHLDKSSPHYAGLKKPLDFAREQGLTRVAEAIEEKLKPLLAKRAAKQAEDLLAQAAQKQAEAEILQREAGIIQPPPQKPPGFKL